MRDADERTLATEQAVHRGVLRVFNEQYAKARAREIERKLAPRGPRKPPDLRKVAASMAHDFPGSVVTRQDH